MPKLNLTRLLPYACDQLFDLILDVPKYPLFLPWCRGAVIDREQGNKMWATLEIGYGHVRARYTSEIMHTRPNEVLVTQAQGPLKHLHNHWLLERTRRGTRLHFDIEFAFQAGLLNAAIQPVFTKAAQEMVGAFEKRARELYGYRGSS